jgi:hypothetical protein
VAPDVHSDARRFGACPRRFDKLVRGQEHRVSLWSGQNERLVGEIASAARLRPCSCRPDTPRRAGETDNASDHIRHRQSQCHHCVPGTRNGCGVTSPQSQLAYRSPRRPGSAAFIIRTSVEDKALAAESVGRRLYGPRPRRARLPQSQDCRSVTATDPPLAP